MSGKCERKVKTMAAAAVAACDGLSLFKTKQCLKATTKPPTHAAEKEIVVMRHGCLRSDITTYRIVFVLQHGQGHSAPQPLETRRISRTLFTDEKGNKCNWKTDKLLLFIHLIPAVLSFKLR